MSRLPQPSAPLIVIADENNNESVAYILEGEPIRQTGTTLENIRPELPNPYAAMDMRIAKRGSELKQREHRADSFGLGKCAQSLLHGGT